MKTSEKKSLFTVISEEYSATVCGGFFLSITFNSPLIYSEPNSLLDAAAAYGIDLNDFKNKLVAAESYSDQ